MVLLPLGERQALVRATLLEHPDWSDRQVVVATGVSRDMVAHHRTLMIDRGEIGRSMKVLGRDGRRYPGPKGRVGSFGLSSRVAAIRRLVAGLGDVVWQGADPKVKALFWLAAERLAEETGRLVEARDRA